MTTASIRKRSGRTPGQRWEPVLLGGAGILILCILLQVAPASGLVNANVIPPLSEVAQAFVAQLARPEFWSALGSTLLGWIIGLSIAIAAGVVFGVLIASIPLLHSLLAGLIDFLRPIPSVIWVPLAVLLLGATMQATLLMVIYASFWPVLLQVMYGVDDVDRVAIDTARTYRISRLRIARRVVWPSIQPYLFVGIRLSATIALLLEITGELIIGSPGIGKLITVAQQSNALTNMYALVWVAAILGVVVGIGVRALEQRTMHWHASIRGDLAV